MHHYEHRTITRQTNARLAAFAIFLAILPSIATAQGNRTGHGDSARRIDISPTHVDGQGLAARFDHPYSIASDGSNIYVADGNHVIRKIVPGAALPY